MTNHNQEAIKYLLYSLQDINKNRLDGALMFAKWAVQELEKKKEA